MNILRLNNPLALRVFLAAFALAAILITSGCLAIAAGAGAGAAVAYSRGQLEAQLSTDLARATHATNHALSELQFAKVSEAVDALNARLIARTSQDKKVDIKLAKITDQATRVRIRVGIFGDESTSLAILDKIKASL